VKYRFHRARNEATRRLKKDNMNHGASAATADQHQIDLTSNSSCQNHPVLCNSSVATAEPCSSTLLNGADTLSIQSVLEDKSSVPSVDGSSESKSSASANMSSTHFLYDESRTDSLEQLHTTSHVSSAEIKPDKSIRSHRKHFQLCGDETGIGGRNKISSLPLTLALPQPLMENRDALSHDTHTISHQTPRATQLTLLTLPMDSLHNVASFLNTNEWCVEFSSTCSTACRIVREIVRRVRMHGFRCATEVITAWKIMQEHADARALAALYISSGVPIYPRVLGYSYRTILWRMHVEATAYCEQRTQPTSAQESDASDIGYRRISRSMPLLSRSIEEQLERDTSFSDENLPDLHQPMVLDPFFTALAAENRLFEQHIRSYLEQKACSRFGWQDIFDAEKICSTYHLQNGAIVASNVNSIKGVAQAPQCRLLDNLDSSTLGKVPTLRIHRHLFDQHMLGHGTVDDHDGQLLTPPVNLSADFFHTSLYKYSSATAILGNLGSDEPSGGANESTMDDRLNARTLDNATSLNELVYMLAPPSNLPIESSRRRLSNERVQSMLSRVNSETYSTNTIGQLMSANGFVSHYRADIQNHLRIRFSTYERRLESFLASHDHPGFEECLLDFWDEFFPLTAMILYHDSHTAVPRPSCLHKFLTNPLPKAIGTMQCEIERIKSSNAGRGVTMKGRLFPTYEYRLFIRHRPLDDYHDDEDSEANMMIRRDTVLIVAKNKGRKHAEEQGSMPIVATSSRKGSNNYYLYMPQQSDVNNHYAQVNHFVEVPLRCPNGGCDDLSPLRNENTKAILLGRLQSNFVGTEFEIFVPRLRKRTRRKDEFTIHSRWDCSRSDNEFDYDHGLGSDNNSFNGSAKRNLFRLKLMRRNHINQGLDSNENVDTSGFSDSESMSGRTHRHRMRRSLSTSDVQSSRQMWSRTNRRAIANNTSENISVSEPALYEEEDGAITYTANLLGSRPRIMDVCIPKVRDDGVRDGQWKAYVDSCCDPEQYRILNCLRRCQQQLDFTDLDHELDQSTDDNSGAVDGGNSASNDFGLTSLQNRPPWWNAELGSFVLNFGGRVSVASVKNFQLCDRANQDTIVLQFGRIQGRHSFTMDYQHPLTAVQAFSIAISSLQSKISFG
jgi:hypothetical protein